VLYDEPRVLLVPLDHRLAGKESVSIDDIAGEPIPRLPDLTTIPLHGVEPSHVVLVTLARDHGRLVAAFRRCARAQLTGPG
jgi:DNA-binding transcriptional LysR family regulator